MDHPPRLTGTKVCSKCGRTLPVICFAVQKSNSDGLRGACRECTDARHPRPKKERLVRRETLKVLLKDNS